VILLHSHRSGSSHVHTPFRELTPSPLPSSTLARVWASLLALLLGFFFVVVPIQGLWRDHWLVRDGQEGMAVITKEHWGGHGVVVYRYRVGQKVYSGQDHRSWQNPKYAHVMAGENTVVYFSSSHPWLSAINLPRNVVIEGLPVMLLAWSIEVGLVVTVINPKSRWTFGLNRRREPSAARDTHLDGWESLKDKMKLVGCGVLLVLAMGAIEVGIDTLFGGK
jgi:hypothetical protein